MRGTCICDTQEPNVVLLCGCISLQCARLALEASAAQVPATYALLEHTLLVAAWRSAGVSSFALMLLVRGSGLGLGCGLRVLQTPLGLVLVGRNDGITLP